MRKRLRPATVANGARGQCVRWEGSGSGLAWHVRAENEVHGHHLVNRGLRRATYPITRRPVRNRPATMSSSRARRTAKSCCTFGSRECGRAGTVATAEVDLALEASRRRSPRGRHDVTSDAANCAPRTANAVSVAVPGAWPLRWTRAAVLDAAEAAKRRKEIFMRLPGGVTTGCERSFIQ